MFLTCGVRLCLVVVSKLAVHPFQIQRQLLILGRQLLILGRELHVS